jgi:metal-responsive CopG/Arc/MetJ family transcriptional regulator
MSRHQRVNFSLPPDVVDLLDEHEQRGDRSEAVAEALREYYDE